MKRILFLINKPRIGGAERAFASQASYLYKNGREIYLANLFGDSDWRDLFSDLAVDQAHLKSFKFKNLFDLREYLLLRRFIKQNKIEVIYSTLEFSNIVARIMKIFCPSLKVIIRESGMADRKKAIFKILDWLLNFFSDNIIAVSASVKLSLAQYQSIHKAKFFILDNSIIPPSWDNIVKARQVLAASKTYLSILNVGWMDDENKGQRNLIEVFGKIVSKNPGVLVRLILIGKGVLREQLEQIVKDKNLNNSIVFTGRLLPEEVAEYYIVADIYVSNSKSEGFSNSLLEAMAFGLPVISTKVGGAVNIIENDHSGVLIESGNNQQLEIAINELLNNKIKRLTMGKAARIRIETNYILERQMEKLAKLFE